MAKTKFYSETRTTGALIGIAGIIIFLLTSGNLLGFALAGVGTLLYLGAWAYSKPDTGPSTDEGDEDDDESEDEGGEDSADDDGSSDDGDSDGGDDGGDGGDGD